jgi:hypothetical protein
VQGAHNGTCVADEKGGDEDVLHPDLDGREETEIDEEKANHTKGPERRGQVADSTPPLHNVVEHGCYVGSQHDGCEQGAEQRRDTVPPERQEVRDGFAPDAVKTMHHKLLD